MSASLYPSAGKDTTAAAQIPGDDIAGLPKRAVGPADRACCCAAKAAVQVIMPPSASRPRWTDLLLCGHHYRAAQRVLTAWAIVRPLPGTSRELASWVGLKGEPAIVPLSPDHGSSVDI